MPRLAHDSKNVTGAPASTGSRAAAASGVPPLLRLAPAVAQTLLMTRAVRRHFSAGEAMTVLAEPCEGMWFLEQGMVDVQLPHPYVVEKLPGPILRAGSIYGSHAHDSDATHGAWLTALDEVDVLEIPSEVLREAIATSPEVQRLHEMVWRNRGLSELIAELVKLIPDEESSILRLLDGMQSIAYAKGDVVLPVGATVDELLIVQRGTVDAESSEARVGRHAQRQKLGAGSVIALAPLLLALPAAHAMVADEPCEVLRLSRGKLDQHFVSCPGFRQALGGLLARSLDTRSPIAAGLQLDESRDVASNESSSAALDGDAVQPEWWQRIPLVRQRDEMECGAACLRIIHAHHGHELEYRASKILARVSRYGTSLMDLAEAAERLGYLATGAEVKDWDSLSQMNLPAIAHVDANHFVVLWRVNKNGVQLSDPAVGRVRQSKDEFMKRYGGYLLVMRPTDALGREPIEAQSGLGAEPRKPKFSARRLWPLVRPMRRLMGHVLVASLLLQAIGLLSPLMTQIVIDRVIGRGEVTLLNVVFAAMVAMTVCQTIVGMSRSFLMLHISLRLERTVMEAVYRRVVSLAHSFFSRFTTGDLVRRFEEVNAIKNFISENAVSVLLDITSVALYASIILYLQPQLAVVYLGLLMLSGVLVMLLVRPVRRHTSEFLVKFGRMQTHIINSFKGIEPIKAMALELPFSRWFGSLLVPTLVQSRNAAKWSILAGVALQFLDGINTSVLLWRGSGMVLADALTLGQLMAFLMLAQQTTGPFLRLLGHWSELQRTLVSLERVGDLLDETPEAQQQEMQGSDLELPNIRGEIRFEDMSFRYTNDPKDASRNVIDSLDVEIAAGEVVGIVGRSGCGKSTLARLLLRFHEPTSGRILLDGFHLRDLNAQSLRRQIGLVTQQAFLYSGTIRENIICGRQDVSDDSMVRATQAAGAYGFITDLPYGFETKVGEQGLQLSGGQAQRIAIARALCANPRILIFDEATAALDPLVERDIHEGLREIIRGRTTLIIAHRLHTLRHADRILVFDSGRLVEQGSHETLMTKQGLYWQMFTASPDWQSADAEASNAGPVGVGA